MPGAGPARPQARRVNVVLSGLLEKCFPDEGRVRRLAGQARGCSASSSPRPRCSGVTRPWIWLLGRIRYCC
ncbi:LON peptidase N-terminal domain and ring finger 2 [Rhinolophus ferrumequinum]|uniref:LON peptidase N-terminal domain and ring finger 2 n=1 Tax=Rhinolophus ferrumequinum TaxID=59479 RepID=A0A7J7V8K1_RHIFE|nr:LON peptidase N-terminal domain and ring finger 2 [Rhinolophus ferrumequinum]